MQSLYFLPLQREVSERRSLRTQNIRDAHSTRTHAKHTSSATNPCPRAEPPPTAPGDSG